MKQEVLEKTKVELEKEKEKNNKQIEIYDERTKMSKVNGIEYKCEATLSLASIGFLLLLILTGILTKLLSPSEIANIFPGITHQIFIIGGSLGIGAITRTLLDKKNKVKERWESFSTAKTQTEKLEEEIRYQIELEKVTNRNLAIDETIRILNLNQETFEKTSGRYNLEDRTAPLTKEDIENITQSLSAIVKEQYDKLDILTTQKVLNDRFWKIRSKLHRFSETIMISQLSGALTMFVAACSSTMMLNITAEGSILRTIIALLTPYIIGVVGSSVYLNKKNQMYKQVFTKLNAQLGKNSLKENFAISYEESFQEQERLEKEIESQIRRIGLAEFQLQETIRHLECFIAKENNKIMTLEQPKKTRNCSETLYTEEKEHFAATSSKINNVEKSEPTKGPRLIKKRIPPKNNNEK